MDEVMVINTTRNIPYIPISDYLFNKEYGVRITTKLATKTLLLFLMYMQVKKQEEVAEEPVQAEFDLEILIEHLKLKGHSINNRLESVTIELGKSGFLSKEPDKTSLIPFFSLAEYYPNKRKMRFVLNKLTQPLLLGMKSYFAQLPVNLLDVIDNYGDLMLYMHLYTNRHKGIWTMTFENIAMLMGLNTRLYIEDPRAHSKILNEKLGLYKPRKWIYDPAKVLMHWDSKGILNKYSLLDPNYCYVALPKPKGKRYSELIFIAQFKNEKECSRDKSYYEDMFDKAKQIMRKQLSPEIYEVWCGPVEFANYNPYAFKLWIYLPSPCFHMQLKAKCPHILDAIKQVFTENVEVCVNYRSAKMNSP